MIFPAGVGDEAVVGAFLDNLPVVKDHDLVAEPAGGQAVADVDGGFVPGNGVEAAVDLVFGHRVQGGGRLIQDQEGRILVQCSGQGDFLGFAAGDFDAAAVEVFVQVAVRPFRHGGQALLKARLVQRLRCFFSVVFRSGGYIFAQTEGKKPEILEHHGEDGHVFVVVVFLDIDAV